MDFTRVYKVGRSRKEGREAPQQSLSPLKGLVSYQLLLTVSLGL